MPPPGDSGLDRRLSRLAGHRVRGGLLSVPDAAALAGAGFEPVSEVIGAVANKVTPGGFYAAGPRPYNATRPTRYTPSIRQNYQTYTSSSGNITVGVPPTIRALKAGYGTALTRLTAEARAVDADGVVGIRVRRTVTRSGGTQLWSFLAVGTAVRATGRIHAPHPFTTDLGGAEVAAAVRGGWIPVALLIVPCMAIRRLDYRSRRQGLRFSSNAEIDGYTDCVNTCRHQARQDFAAAARQVRADGAVMSDMTLEFETEGGEACTASVTVTGTALARFVVRGAGEPPPLTVLPLGARL